MIVFNLFLLTFIIVYIVDISGAVDSLKSGLKWLITKGKMKDNNYTLKPFDCSLCLTFWVGLTYLLITGYFTLPYIAVVCFLSAFSDIFKNTILLLEDLFIKLQRVINKVLKL